MDLYGKHFTYAGISSREYDLVITSMTSSVFSRVRGEERSEKFYGRKAWRDYSLGTIWDGSPVSFSVEVARQTALSAEEIRQIEKWLFNRTSYAKLYMDAEDDYDNETSETIDGQVKRLYLNCKMTNPSKLRYDSGIVGFSFTMECDSGFAHQDAITKIFDIAGDQDFSGLLALDIDSDMPGYLYPKVTITTGSSGGDITIINMTDSSTRQTRILSVPASTSVILNGEINYVSSGYYTSFPGQNFLRLLDGENSISVTGDVATLKFEWSNVRNL